MVDSAIDAAAEWQRSGRNANSHGAFPAAWACDALVERVDDVMGELLGANPAGMVYGPSTTANMMSLTRAVAHGLGPGDEIVCTTLDHDANVAPWLLAARDSGALVRMAAVDWPPRRLPTWSVRPPGGWPSPARPTSSEPCLTYGPSLRLPMPPGLGWRSTGSTSPRTGR